MSSSLAVPSSVEPARLVRPDLLQALSGVSDPRAARGVRHRLAAVLGVAVSAVLAGAKSYTAISEWVQDASVDVLAELGVGEGRAPSESTIRRTLARVDGDWFDAVIGAWMRTRTGDLAGRRVIAVDGKTVRGARSGDRAAPHLVSGLDHGLGVVLGQVQVAFKSNEIPALRTLLEPFDLAGVVVTADAMHTQKDTATYITDRGADYVLTVKGNQPGLLARCKALPWNQVPSVSTTGRGHGRRMTRTIKVVQAPGVLDFPGAVQVAQLRRTRTIKGKKSIEVVYLITSMDARQGSPSQLAAWVQGHWAIENCLHWVRDVTFDEDRSQIRTGHGPHVMATLRNTAISLLRLAGWTNIAQALRHHARNARRPLTLLLTC
jgi:predicted transposase YbfD/YdcC